MFEKLTSHCCNYSRGVCLGAFFKISGNERVDWIEPYLVGNRCLVSDRHYCWWFDSIVVPGIAEHFKTPSLLNEIKEWHKLVDELRTPLETGKYRKLCKKCGHGFVASSAYKRYCESCRKSQNVLSRRKATQQYKKKHWGDKNGPISEPKQPS